jgi:hypothetical protein
MNAATPFHTPRLKRMAERIGMHLSDTLKANVLMDSIAVLNGKDIHIRTNGFGDVEHIGYNLFSTKLREQKEDSPVFDFLERYLLELDLQLDDKSPALRKNVDDVTEVKGTLQMLKKLTPKSDVKFDIDIITRKMYRVTCEFGENRVRVTFPSINELLVGANMIEMEEIFRRDVQRMIPIPGDAIITDWTNATTTRSKDEVIVGGGMYFSNMIRGDIYLVEKAGVKTLLCDSGKESRSISNIMLTGIFERTIPLKLAIDRYSGERDSIEITLQQFVAYCKAEGCKLYFGIKTISEDELTGTFFAYNERLSYDHMLSVWFPLTILKGEDGAVRGKVYTYIPLHQMPDKYFELNQELN